MGGRLKNEICICNFARLLWYQMKGNDTNSTHTKFQLDRGLSSRDTAHYSCIGREGRGSPKTTLLGTIPPSGYQLTRWRKFVYLPHKLTWPQTLAGVSVKNLYLEIANAPVPQCDFALRCACVAKP